MCDFPNVLKKSWAQWRNTILSKWRNGATLWAPLSWKRCKNWVATSSTSSTSVAEQEISENFLVFSVPMMFSQSVNACCDFLLAFYFFLNWPHDNPHPFSSRNIFNYIYIYTHVFLWRFVPHPPFFFGEPCYTPSLNKRPRKIWDATTLAPNLATKVWWKRRVQAFIPALPPIGILNPMLEPVTDGKIKPWFVWCKFLVLACKGCQIERRSQCMCAKLYNGKNQGILWWRKTMKRDGDDPLISEKLE